VAALAELVAEQGSLFGIGRYPDPTAGELRAALEGYTRIPASQIVVGNGLDEVLALLAEALLQPGDEVVVAEPTFSVYSEVARWQGARVIDVGLNEHFEVDPKHLVNAIGPKTRLVMLCSPNNPTGTPLPRQTVLAALERSCEMEGSNARGGPLVAVDEAYYEFGAMAGDPTIETAVPLLQQGQRIVVLRTFSKIFGLAGLRVGYGLCPPDVVAYLLDHKQVYNVNIAGQVAALAALNDLAWLAERARCIVSERERMWEALSRMSGLYVHRSAANFLLVELSGGARPRDALWEALLDHGILVRRPPGERMGAALRITVGRPEQNERFLGTLRALLPAGGVV
jgi:histidinol-phosphate aminotransferase